MQLFKNFKLSPPHEIKIPVRKKMACHGSCELEGREFDYQSLQRSVFGNLRLSEAFLLRNLYVI